jgi:hypothetical protein
MFFVISLKKQKTKEKEKDKRQKEKDKEKRKSSGKFRRKGFDFFVSFVFDSMQQTPQTIAQLQLVHELLSQGEIDPEAFCRYQHRFRQKLEPRPLRKKPSCRKCGQPRAGRSASLCATIVNATSTSNQGMSLHKYLLILFKMSFCSYILDASARNRIVTLCSTQSL